MRALDHPQRAGRCGRTGRRLLHSSVPERSRPRQPTATTGSEDGAVRGQRRAADLPEGPVEERLHRDRTVRKVEARLVQLKLLEKRYLDNEYGTMTRYAVKKFQNSKGIPPLGYVDQNTSDKLAAVTHEPTQTELLPAGARGQRQEAGRALRDRCRAVHRQVQPQAAVRHRRRGEDAAGRAVRRGEDGRPARAASRSAGRAATTSRSCTTRPMPYAMFFSGGQAVHYSSDFAARGYNGASHGCVNVRDLGKIQVLFDQVKSATR